MKKKLFAMALALTGVVALAGCGKDKTAGDNITTTSGTTEIVAPKLTDLDADDYIKKIGDYDGLIIEATLENITDAKVDETIHSLIEARATIEEVEGRALKNGDIANINYAGKMNGEAFEGGTDDSEAGYDLEIGSGSFIPGFEEALIGMNQGETRDIDLVFPNEYYEELAGKPVTFTVTLNKVKEKVYPELTDAFVAEQGIDDVNTVDELKTYVKNRLVNDAQEQYDTTIDNAIMNKLVELCEYKDKLPEDRIQYYYDSVHSRDEQAAVDYGLMLEGYIMYVYGYSDLDTYEVKLKDYATKSVKYDLAVLKVLEKEGQTVTDDELNKSIEEEYEKYGFASVDEFKNSYNLDEYKAYLMSRKALDIIRAKSTIVDAAE